MRLPSPYLIRRPPPCIPKSKLLIEPNVISVSTESFMLFVAQAAKVHSQRSSIAQHAEWVVIRQLNI